MNHTLLPQYLQDQLKAAAAAAATERLDMVDAAIDTVHRQAPAKFHTEASLKTRVFFDEPRGNYVGTFIKPAPSRI
jgi:hypothetical protein